MTEQLDIFSKPPVCPQCGGRGYVMVRRECACRDESVLANTPGKAHGGAHVTEKLAALRTAPRTGRQRWRVLMAISRAFIDGRVGLTDEEIAVSPGVADTAHRTRRNELVRGEWVEDSGQTRRTRSGDDSIIWTLTDKGRDWCRLNGEAA